MKTGWDRWDRIMFAVAAACLAVGAADLAFFDGFAVGVLLTVEGTMIFTHRYHLRFAHNAGWLNGRGAMVSSMFEAQARHMPIAHWLLAEAERDGFGAEMLAAMQRREQGDD